MFDRLTDEELSALQRLLFTGAEDMFRAATHEQAGSGRAERIRGTHEEIAGLFIEAGTELLWRLLQPAAVT
jgi:hypothetical protein